MWLPPGLNFSPDGSALAYATGRGGAALLDLQTGNSRELPNPDRGDLLALSFSKDGKTIASAGMDSVIKIRRLPQGDIVKQLTNHTAFVSCLQFSPTGRWLASCGADQTIRLFDVNDWLEAKALRGRREAKAW
jgi:WD40 repeat protein